MTNTTAVMHRKICMFLSDMLVPNSPRRKEERFVMHFPYLKLWLLYFSSQNQSRYCMKGLAGHAFSICLLYFFFFFLVKSYFLLLTINIHTIKLKPPKLTYKQTKMAQHKTQMGQPTVGSQHLTPICFLSTTTKQGQPATKREKPTSKMKPLETHERRCQ